MKIAWGLIIIGVLLLLDGTIRIIMGIASGNLLLSFAGVLTGWLLGSWLLIKGRRRLKRIKTEGNNNAIST